MSKENEITTEIQISPVTDSKVIPDLYGKLGAGNIFRRRLGYGGFTYNIYANEKLDNEQLKRNFRDYQSAKRLSEDGELDKKYIREIGVPIATIIDESISAFKKELYTGVYDKTIHNIFFPVIRQRALEELYIEAKTPVITHK